MSAKEERSVSLLGLKFERSKRSFMDLPPEMHLEIISHLSYPDALALKHTNTYFYSLVTTNVQFRIQWIIERFSLGLPVRWKKCELGTDALFCNNDVRWTMEKRRQHRECKAGAGGCVVILGSNCGGGSMLGWQLKRFEIMGRKGRKAILEHQVLIAGMLMCLLVLLSRILGVRAWSWIGLN